MIDPKKAHGNLGSFLVHLVKNTIQGRDLENGLATSAAWVLDYNGHMRVMLDDIARLGNTVVATTHTGTEYTIDVLSDQATTRLCYMDAYVETYFALRRANVSIQPVGERLEVYENVFFSYDISTGAIAIFDGDQALIRRSSTVRTFEVT